MRDQSRAREKVFFETKCSRIHGILKISLRVSRSWIWRLCQTLCSLNRFDSFQDAHNIIALVEFRIETRNEQLCLKLENKPLESSASFRVMKKMHLNFRDNNSPSTSFVCFVEYRIAERKIEKWLRRKLKLFSFVAIFEPGINQLNVSNCASSKKKRKIKQRDGELFLYSSLADSNRDFHLHLFQIVSFGVCQRHWIGQEVSKSRRELSIQTSWWW